MLKILYIIIIPNMPQAYCIVLHSFDCAKVMIATAEAVKVGNRISVSAFVGVVIEIARVRAIVN